MSAKEARYYLQQTKRKYISLRLIEIFFGAAALFFLTWIVALLTKVGYPTSLLIPILVSVVYFGIRSFQLNVFRIRENSLVHYINDRYPQMEESTDLILADDQQLTSLQLLQKQRSMQHFEILYPKIKFPHHLGRALILFTVSVAIYFAVVFVYMPNKNGSSLIDSGPDFTVVQAKLPASIEKGTITIIPPKYTRIGELKTTNFNLKIREGTNIQWDIAFTEGVTEPQLIFSGKDSISLQNSGEHSFQGKRTFQSNAFYQVQWQNVDGSKKYSDYYQVEVMKDQPPAIHVENLEQFIEFKANDNLKVNLKSSLTDDYGLNDAYIIATVSKGSGESVKFREEKIRFDKPVKITGTNVSSSLLIDLLRLGLEPGDELYFYVEARDNKQPLSNKSRTETFFISLQDTATVTTSVDPGLGVDLMPEYFRSQRQIIIDSEKLLKEKRKITKESFNSRSNELGYDQKVLRLRYGEFLGEEFESGIGPQAEIPGAEDPDEEEEDVTKKYGHVHDKENEHNLIEEKKSPGRDTHGHDQQPDPNSDPAKEYMHMHDTEEEATFFTQSIRAKLKAAITIMWDAELHLRLYDPEKSLPFQYKALKLLKEISQDSRIYVHRTGFDPPPLKEEKRLTGDLTEIKNSTEQNNLTSSITYPNIRKASSLIELLLPKDEINLSTEIKSMLSKAGQELSVAAINQPGRYLKTLSLLKALNENELDPHERRNALIKIRSAFWNVIPPENTSPQASSRTTHTLDKLFIDNLKALKQN